LTEVICCLGMSHRINQPRPLRANISETVLVLLINEQGEKEKGRDGKRSTAHATGMRSHSLIKLRFYTRRSIRHASHVPWWNCLLASFDLYRI